MELPLATRNLNASVYALGPSFEPVGRDYRSAMIDETNARNKEIAKAYEGFEIPDSDDIDELNEMIKDMTQRLTVMEEKILEADLADEVGEKVRLKEEADKLRFQRDNTVTKVKALKVEGVRSASQSGVSTEFQDKIRKLEDQSNAMRLQISALRNDLYDMRDSLYLIMDRLGISRYNDSNNDD